AGALRAGGGLAAAARTSAWGSSIRAASSASLFNARSLSARSGTPAGVRPMLVRVVEREEDVDDPEAGDRAAREAREHEPAQARVGLEEVVDLPERSPRPDGEEAPGHESAEDQERSHGGAGGPPLRAGARGARSPRWPP